MVGRTTLLTPEVTAVAVELVEKGLPVSAAGEALGVRSDTIRGWIRRGQERDDELIDPIDGLLKTWSGILFKRTAQADDIANLDPWKRIAAYEDSGDENAIKNATAHLQHRVRALLDEADPLPKRVANLANPLATIINSPPTGSGGN